MHLAKLLTTLASDIIVSTRTHTLSALLRFINCALCVREAVMIKAKPGEIAVWDRAVIYKRGGVWQWRYWIAAENQIGRAHV